MTTLLHVSASPRGAASESLALASTFLATYREAHPGVTVDTLDLWAALLPRFGPVGASAKVAVFTGGSLNAEQPPCGRRPSTGRPVHRRRRVPVQRADVERRGAVRVQAVDRHHHPARHAVRLRPGHRLHRAGARQEGRGDLHQRCLRPGVPIEYGTDFHSSFVTDWLRFVGVTDVTEIRFQPTLLTATPAEDRAAAHAAAREAAKVF